MKLERGLVRPFCPQPFCTVEETPNFADFQRKTPQEIRSNWFHSVALLPVEIPYLESLTRGCGTSFLLKEKHRSPGVSSEQTTIHFQLHEAVQFLYINKILPSQKVYSSITPQLKALWQKMAAVNTAADMISNISKQPGKKENNKDSLVKRFKTSNMLIFYFPLMTSSLLLHLHPLTKICSQDARIK